MRQFHVQDQIDDWNSALWAPTPLKYLFLSVSHEQGPRGIETVTGKGHRCFAQGGRTTADVTARTCNLFYASWKAYTPH